MTSGEQLIGAVAAILTQAGEPPGEVTGIDRLSGGASRETWAIDTGAGGRYVLQRTRRGAVSGGPGMVGEAALLRAAAGFGVPVPAVIAAGEDDGIGAPYVVTRHVPGESIPRRILRDEALPGARRVLVGQCARALAGIHRIPRDSVPGLRGGDQLDLLRDLLDGLGEPHPAFELALRWLEEHRPEPGPEVVVHGDFRLGNLLVDEQGLAAVLDWELAHLGDPVEDLGWLCVKAWRFGGQDPVAGLGRYEELLAAYAAAGGERVELDRLRWWEILGTFRWGVICILQAHGHLSGLSRSVELAAIGRRVCETEHDLLELLP